MGLTAIRFSSLLFAALALAPALAHLLELPNKIGLARDHYLTVQQIYRVWALLESSSLERCCRPLCLRLWSANSATECK
jgi:hypothetical protein